jgi:O-antigen/teichoic acid export membrane protein
MNRTKSALLGAISSQVYTIISVILNIFSIPIIVKHLNSEIYGLSVIIFQVTAYLGMFDFGLTAGIERYLAGTRDNNTDNKLIITKIVSTSLIVYSVIALIVIVIGNIFAPFAGHIFNAPAKYLQSIHHIIAWLSALLGFQLILRAITGIFFAHQRQFLSNTLSFFLVVGNIICTVCFVDLGYGLWSFVYSQATMSLLYGAVNLYFFRIYYPYIKIDLKNFEFQMVREMFSYGFSLFLTGIAVQVIFQTDRVIIGSLISFTAVSIYTFTAKLPELTSQLVWKISDNSFPALVELSKKTHAVSSLKTAHDKLMQVTLSCTTTIFWLVILFSYPFIKLWVGEEYYAGFLFTALVSYLYLIQLTFIHVTSVCLNGLGIARRLTVSALIEAVINLAMSLYLVKIYGLKGAITATIVGGLLTSFWYVPYLSIRYFKSTWLDYLSRVLKPMLVCSIFDGLFYYFLKNKVHDIHSWLNFLLLGVAAFCLFLIPIAIINRQLFKDIAKKIY